MLNAQTKRIGMVGFALIMVAALLAWGLAGAIGGATGTNDTLGYKGFVEWKVFGPDGVLKASGANPNAVTDDGLDRAMERLIDPTETLAASGNFSRIVAVDVPTGADADGVTELMTDGITAGNIALLLDGSGNDATHENPAQGAYAAGAADDGSGTITVTYTAAGAVTIRQLGLVQAAVDDTAAAGAVAIAEADVLAHQGVNITLADDDTLQVTWTVDVN